MMMNTNAGAKVFAVSKVGNHAKRLFSSGQNNGKLCKSKTSSNQWVHRQSNDPFVKQAYKDNYRCRSAYKLLQIDDKYRFLHPGMVVIDCGASPGSWCQVAVEKVNATGSEPGEPIGRVIGIDLQHISPIEGANILSLCDFTQQTTQAKIQQLLAQQKADVILSDMAPRASGVKSFNHQYIIGLCFSVLHFSLHNLHIDGSLLCKLWMGSEQERFKTAVNHVFETVAFLKPKSSRPDSAEIFCLARGFKGIPKKS